MERTRLTLNAIVQRRRLVVVASHVTYVAKDVNAVTVPVQCPPNWAPVAIGNETFCGTFDHRSIVLPAFLQVR